MEEFDEAPIPNNDNYVNIGNAESDPIYANLNARVPYNNLENHLLGYINSPTMKNEFQVRFE